MARCELVDLLFSVNTFVTLAYRLSIEPRGPQSNKYNMGLILWEIAIVVAYIFIDYTRCDVKLGSYYPIKKQTWFQWSSMEGITPSMNSEDL